MVVSDLRDKVRAAGDEWAEAAIPHIAVMDDRISSIATLVRLSRITHGLLVENIAFAIGVKIIFALLALT